MAQEANARDSSDDPGLSKNEPRVEMTDDGVFDGRQPAADGFIAPKERKRRRIVAKEDDASPRLQTGESLADFGEMRFTQTLPFGALARQRIRLVHRQGNERGSHTEKRVSARIKTPERTQPKFAVCVTPASQPHPAAAAGETKLSEFVIADDGEEIRLELFPQFA